MERRLEARRCKARLPVRRKRERMERMLWLEPRQTEENGGVWERGGKAIAGMRSNWRRGEERRPKAENVAWEWEACGRQWRAMARGVGRIRRCASSRPDTCGREEAGRRTEVRRHEARRPDARERAEAEKKLCRRQRGLLGSKTRV